MNKHQIPKTYFLCCLLITFLLKGYGQEEVSGIVNDYIVVNDIFSCNNSMIVEQANLLKPGNEVLIYQAKGASIVTSNNESFGQIERIGEAGRYELNEVKNIVGDTVFLRFQFMNFYEVDGHVQLVRVADYESVVIQDTLKALPWDGEKGGIIALRAENSVVLNAPNRCFWIGISGW